MREHDENRTTWSGSYVHGLIFIFRLHVCFACAAGDATTYSGATRFAVYPGTRFAGFTVESKY